MDRKRQHMAADCYNRLNYEIEDLWLLLSGGNDPKDVLVCLEKMKNIVINMQRLYLSEISQNEVKKTHGFDYFFRGWE